MGDILVHLCIPAEWQVAQQAGEYRAPSLESEGFIHCSRPEQIAGVANRFYAGQRRMCLLWLDAAKLDAEVRWEAADGEVFPHVYGPIPAAAVLRVTPFEPDEAGIFYRPEEPGF